MECPKCRVMNSDNTLRCDCGYTFEHLQDNNEDTIASQKIIENNPIRAQGMKSKMKDKLFDFLGIPMLFIIFFLFIAGIIGGGIFLIIWVGSKGGLIDNIENKSLKHILTIGFIIILFLLAGYFASFRGRR